MQSIGIIGAGAFGTAMATVARRAGRDVVVWAYEDSVADDINTNHTNATYLKGAVLDRALRASTDLAEVCAADAVLVAVPSQHLGAVISQAAPHWRPGVPAMTCSKGVERGTCRLMAEVVRDCLSPHFDSPPIVATMGGPTFAIELARDLPSAATIACPDLRVAQDLSPALASANFRTDVTTDIVGAQLGGAVKNVLAIACGIVHGKGLGDNARAALITRGLAEMTRLGLVLGAEPATLMGMAGLGDVTLTCNAMQSRNFSLGNALGQGQSIDAILAERNTVAEGYFNAESVTELARRNQVDMPICQAVEAVLTVEADLDSIIQGLLARPLAYE